MGEVSVLQCSQVEIDILCILSMLMSGLCVVTVVAYVISVVHQIKDQAKDFLDYQIVIHYSIIAQVTAQLVYFSLYDHFIVHTLYEVLKLLTFICIGHYFALSAFKLNLIPIPSCSQRALNTCFLGTLLSVVSATVVVSIYTDICPNIGRLMFAITQFCFAIFFAVISYWILRSVKSSDTEPTISPSSSLSKLPRSSKKTVSVSFMVRHTRPLTVLMIIYIWTSSINLGLQIFLYYISYDTTFSCHQVLKAQGPEIKISYPVFKQIDSLVPLWTILWYFYATSLRKENLNTLLPTSQPAVPQSYRSFDYNYFSQSDTNSLFGIIPFSYRNSFRVSQDSSASSSRDSTIQ